MLGTLSYALIVRPTFLRMRLGAPVIAEEEVWSAELSRTLLLSLGL